MWFGVITFLIHHRSELFKERRSLFRVKDRGGKKIAFFGMVEGLQVPAREMP